eukprot:SAG11_NODE_482_length_9072_cov_12.361306_8_plen_84_part_00
MQKSATGSTVYLAPMSPDVRKKLKGHHLSSGTLFGPWLSAAPSPQSPGPSCPQWQFSIRIGLPDLFRRLAKTVKFKNSPQPSL